ncbi:MAG: PfkB family carbohydrate kinase [Desulfuromonadales bacterium]|jgi:sulfofructose kinase
MTSSPHTEVIGLGQCSLDFLGQLDAYPGLDEKTEMSSLLTQGGGPVATALVTLARLGVAVAMIGAVGRDDFGRRIRAELLAEKVDCRYLREQTGAVSQVAFIAVDAAGHRNIFWHRSSAVIEIPDSLPEILSAARILHLDGLDVPAAVAAAETARQLKIVTVLDAGALRPGIDRLLPLIDHLVVSERFARQAIGSHDPLAALIHLCGPETKAVTVTCGRAGCYTMEATGASFHQPAFPVAAVDTTGCGDVFHGGYIYGLLQGWPLPETVRFAAAVAALKTRALGGRTAIPSLPDVQRFLQRHAHKG